MDLIQSGKFIAKLRKKNGLTQEELGEKLFVTNKTVSRWETGTYMPPVDALALMSELFDVSINELLAGKYLNDSDYKLIAEENLKNVLSESSFNLKDKIEYFKKKWLKEHVAFMISMAIILMIIFFYGIVSENGIVIIFSGVLLIVFHGIRNNSMMTYVEKNVFGNDKN